MTPEHDGVGTDGLCHRADGCTRQTALALRNHEMATSTGTTLVKHVGDIPFIWHIAVGRVRGQIAEKAATVELWPRAQDLH